MKKIFASLLLAGASLSVVAQPVPKQQFVPLAMDPKLHYGVLPNGMTYYIRHNEKEEKRADFYIIQNVGSILEEEGQKGLAHFLEHMAFQGTKNLPNKKIIEYLESVGVKFGANINAYTSIDETVYNLDAVPTYRKGIVDTALMVLHDWSGFLTLDDTEIDKERGVIREEWRTTNTADQRMWKASLSILFPNSQYGKRDVIGDTAIINNFPYDTLRAYYNKWYRPDLQAIVIVGDIDADAIEKQVKEMFSDIPKRVGAVPRPYYEIEDNKEPIIAIVTDPEAQQTYIDIDYRHRPMPDVVKASATGYAYNTMNNLVTSMLTARLAEICQEANSPFASAFAAYGELVRTRDAFSLFVNPNEGKEKEAFERLLLEAERARRYGFTQTELDRAKANMLSVMEKYFNEKDKQPNNDFVKEYQRNFLDFEPIPGIEWEFATIQELLPAITLEDMNKMLHTDFFSDENMTVEIMGPEKYNSIFTHNSVRAQLAEMPNLNVGPYIDKVSNEPLIAKTPKAGKVKKVSQNKDFGYEEWLLSNGMKVVFKPTNFKEDEILLSAFCEGGLSLESNIDKLPSAKVAADVVESNGLGNFNAIALRKALAGKMVNISPNISNYEHSLSGWSSVKDFESLLQLFFLYFTDVRADEDGFTSMVNQYQTLLVNRAADPSTAFSDSITAIVNGYSPRVAVLDSVQLAKVQQDDALAFFKKCFNNPADFTVVLTGNIDKEKFKKSILTYLGGLMAQKTHLKWVDHGIRVPKGKNVNNFKKELRVKKASNFVYLTCSTEPTLKNKICLQVIREILDSRYLESMRESEGGTYGVDTRTGFKTRPVNRAVIQMIFDTDPLLEDKLMTLIDKEIETIIANGPKEDDLQKAKEILLKSHKEDIRDNRYWKNVISTYYKEGVDELTGFENIVNALTGTDVQRMITEIYKLGSCVQVVMLPK